MNSANLTAHASLDRLDTPAKTDGYCIFPNICPASKSGL